MIKVAKRQGFNLSLEDTFLKKTARGERSNLPLPHGNFSWRGKMSKF